MDKLDSELYDAIERSMKQIGLDEDKFYNNGFVIEGLIRVDGAEVNKEYCVCKTPLELFNEKKKEILARLEKLERVLRIKKNNS